MASSRGSPGSDLLAEQLRNDLGVSLGLAVDACVLKLIPQGQVILDDSVVYEGDPPISRGVRVGVDVVRAAMGRPSGVPDAKSAARQRFLGQYLLEIAELAGLLRDVQPFVGHNGNACRVVAAVFQTPQTLDHDIQRRLPPDVPDDSAHRRNCTFPARPRWAVAIRLA